MTYRVVFCFVDYDKKTVLAMGMVEYRRYPREDEVEKYLKEKHPQLFDNYAHAWAVVALEVF